MTDKERMQELVDFYCNADARAREDKEKLAAYSPTLGEAMEMIMGEGV